MRRARAFWPLLAGVAAALIALLVAAAVGAVGEALIGIHLRGWLVALLLLCIGLSGQLILSDRVALQWERRLVHAAASLRALTGQLELLATTDDLTGLANRRVFFERLGVEYRRALRYGRPLSLIMADLDHFKAVNDQFGHPFGDLVLSVTAQAVRSNVRESDLVARYGGEEFVLMLPENGPCRGDSRRREAAPRDRAAGVPGRYPAGAHHDLTRRGVAPGERADERGRPRPPCRPGALRRQAKRPEPGGRRSPGRAAGCLISAGWREARG